MPEKPDYGQIAYEAYHQRGTSRLQWKNLLPNARARWEDVGEAVAEAAYDYLEDPESDDF